MNNFLLDIKRFIGWVPFVKNAVVLYFCMINSHTPLAVRTMIAGTLAYFLLPTDAIPDFLGILGLADDASLVATTSTDVSMYVTEKHRQQANDFFAQQ